MIDTKQIPYLIRFLDDEAPEIRLRAIDELISFGPLVQEVVRQSGLRLSQRQKEILNEVFRQQQLNQLKKKWMTWFAIKDEYVKLEKALSILADFLNSKVSPDLIYASPYSQLSVKILLDDLAEEYRRKFTVTDKKQLARFLFKEKGLIGNENDYYNPQNSNLIYVIQRKRGIPLSLTSIYMLVGARLGLHIEGCNYPGHFLARIHDGDRKLYVDCFGHGRVFETAEIVRMKQEVAGVEVILREEITAEIMIRRYLANLIQAFQMAEDHGTSHLMIELAKDLDASWTKEEIEGLTPDDIIGDPDPMFQPGDTVIHARYGYRGIVVDVEPYCMATDAWYYGNQTQPDRNQPWYHLLVHATDQVTYVAESNLIPDAESERIEHPLLSYFFKESKDGLYIRNNNPWPDEEDSYWPEEE